MPPPSNFFHFHAVFGKTSCQKIDYCPHLWGRHSPPPIWEILDPPLLLHPNWILSFPMFGSIWLRGFNLILCKIIFRVSRGNHFTYRVETSHQCDYSLRDIHKIFLIHPKHNSAFTLTKTKTDTMARNATLTCTRTFDTMVTLPKRFVKWYIETLVNNNSELSKSFIFVKKSVLEIQSYSLMLCVNYKSQITKKCNISNNFLVPTLLGITYNEHFWLKSMLKTVRLQWVPLTTSKSLWIKLLVTAGPSVFVEQYELFWKWYLDTPFHCISNSESDALWC